jgi:hypothetical protein
MAYNPVGTTLSTDRRGYEEWVKLDDTDKACVFANFYLGGSRSIAISGTGYQDAVDYLDFVMPDAASTGGTYAAKIDLLCESGSTTITPRIRNITDSSDAVVGSASSSTSWTTQTLTFTPASGKTYRLQVVKSDDLNACWAIGYLRRTNA